MLKIVVANRPVYLNYDCEPTNFTFLSEVLLPIMAELGGSARKGNFFYASGISKGKDFTVEV